MRFFGMSAVVVMIMIGTSACEAGRDEQRKHMASTIQGGLEMGKAAEALRLYAHMHEGSFPPRIEDAFVRDDFWSSSDTKLPRQEWQYHGAGRTMTVDEEYLILFEHDPTHRSEGINVVWSNGTAERMTATQLREAVIVP
jgi:hypothetical protein